MLLHILIIPLVIWLLWVFYVAVMRLQMVRDAKKLTATATVLAYFTLFVGLFLDLVVNVVVMSIVLLERPREWTVSRRLYRHSSDADGWRMRVCLWLRVNLLDEIDPDGIHKG